MATGKSGRRPPARRAKASGRAEPAPAAKPVRPVLGNDPFARGAAPREPAAPLLRAATTSPPPATASATSTSTPTSTPTATSTSTPTATSTPTPTPTPAPAPAATSTATRTSTSTRTASSTPSRSATDRTREAAQRLAALERRVETTLEGLESRLASVATRAAIAGVGAGGELRVAAARLLPRAREVLAGIVELVRLVEPPDRLDPWGQDPRFAERAEPILDLLYGGWWRVEAHGLEGVPATGPLVVVANHGGLVPWDTLVLRHALRRAHPAHRDLRPLLDDRECAMPLFGAAAIRIGAVRSAPEAAEAILRGGGAVGVFPEGSAGARKSWGDRYRIQQFGRGGFVKIALRTGATIVPCAIVGSEEATPPLARTGWLADLLGVPALSSPLLRIGAAAVFPLPSKWSLRFGEPFSTDGLGPDAADDATAVNTLTERVRATLQSMLDESVAGRGSVFL